jgi:hypothetical protein
MSLYQNRLFSPTFTSACHVTFSSASPCPSILVKIHFNIIHHTAIRLRAELFGVRIPAQRSNQPPIQRVPGFFPGVKWPGRQVNYWPPPSAEAKNDCGSLLCIQTVTKWTGTPWPSPSGLPTTSQGRAKICMIKTSDTQCSKAEVTTRWCHCISVVVVPAPRAEEGAWLCVNTCGCLWQPIQDGAKYQLSINTDAVLILRVLYHNLHCRAFSDYLRDGITGTSDSTIEKPRIPNRKTGILKLFTVFLSASRQMPG